MSKTSFPEFTELSREILLNLLDKIVFSRKALASLPISSPSVLDGSAFVATVRVFNRVVTRARAVDLT